MVWWSYVSMIKGWDCMNSEIEKKKCDSYMTN
jgi:hypothetical protein